MDLKIAQTVAKNPVAFVVNFYKEFQLHFSSSKKEIEQLRATLKQSVIEIEKINKQLNELSKIVDRQDKSIKHLSVSMQRKRVPPMIPGRPSPRQR